MGIAAAHAHTGFFSGPSVTRSAIDGVGRFLRSAKGFAAQSTYDRLPVRAQKVGTFLRDAGGAAVSADALTGLAKAVGGVMTLSNWTAENITKYSVPVAGTVALGIAVSSTLGLMGAGAATGAAISLGYSGYGALDRSRSFRENMRSMGAVYADGATWGKAFQKSLIGFGIGGVFDALINPDAAHASNGSGSDHGSGHGSGHGGHDGGHDKGGHDRGGHHDGGKHDGDHRGGHHDGGKHDGDHRGGHHDGGKHDGDHRGGGHDKPGHDKPDHRGPDKPDMPDKPSPTPDPTPEPDPTPDPTPEPTSPSRDFDNDNDRPQPTRAEPCEDGTARQKWLIFEYGECLPEDTGAVSTAASSADGMPTPLVPQDAVEEEVVKADAAPVLVEPVPMPEPDPCLVWDGTFYELPELDAQAVENLKDGADEYDTIVAGDRAIHILEAHYGFDECDPESIEYVFGKGVTIQDVLGAVQESSGLENINVITTDDTLVLPKVEAITDVFADAPPVDLSIDAGNYEVVAGDWGDRILARHYDININDPDAVEAKFGEGVTKADLQRAVELASKIDDLDLIHPEDKIVLPTPEKIGELFGEPEVAELKGAADRATAFAKATIVPTPDGQGAELLIRPVPGVIDLEQLVAERADGVRVAAGAPAPVMQ